MFVRFTRIVTFAVGAASLWVTAPARSDEAKDALIVETILRLDDFDLSGSEKAQAAVSRYLENNWAGERYLDLIERFDIREEAPGVLRLALEKVDDPIGTDASNLLVALGGGNLLVEVLSSRDATEASRAAKAIAHSGDSKLLSSLSAVIADDTRSTELRAAALAASVGSNPDKHTQLLEKVKTGKLPDELRQTASEILLLSRDPNVRREAQALFAAESKDYPEVSDLIRRDGDLANGKKIFATKTCAVCHVADEVGINFGPGLSEIGDKLDKEALFRAIIEPSAGISMGFEGWEITLKDGTPLVGIVEETGEGFSLTMIGGAKRIFSNDEVAKKKKLDQSLMYPGLHRLMTPQELVDLVEYLSSLKKRASSL